MRKLLIGAAVTLLATVIGAGMVFTPGARAAVNGPTVAFNPTPDLDHTLAFSSNKQNEPAVTRDPLTGVLVAGANDEIGQPPCTGTTTPLASPCPFKPGVNTSAFYRSTDNGLTWSGGYLPGFDTLGPPAEGE